MLMRSTTTDFINQQATEAALQRGGRVDASQVRQVLGKALQLEGLNEGDVAALMAIESPQLLDELYATAHKVKQEIYGSRLVLFAPLYISSLCRNECVYCAFRAGNRLVHRRVLSQDEISAETKALLEQGHNRVLLVAGESYPEEGFDYVLNSIQTIYATKLGKDEIRRINVNVAPLTVEQFRSLKATGIGTYQIFQETYHRPTYAKMHLAGPKRDYDWRVTAPARAMEAGIDDVGIGVLFGLYDWRFEVMSLLQHIRQLEAQFGVGPHTISVPRLEPAEGAPLSSDSPWAVSDVDFCKIIAILRLAVPYTGIILSTRESADVRRRALAMGVSQISAGSRTNPGGYSLGEDSAEQFQLGDHRPLDEVIRDVAEMGYVPSFCTACYRLGRTGADFMDLAKPGLIKIHCGTNGLLSFKEYLLDHASPRTRLVGEQLIERELGQLKPLVREHLSGMLRSMERGKRDLFV